MLALHRRGPVPVQAQDGGSVQRVKILTRSCAVQAAGAILTASNLRVRLDRRKRRKTMSALTPRTIALALALCGSAASAAAPKPDNLVPSGQPVNCVQTNLIRNTNVRDDSTIDFVMSGGQVYRNTLPNSCPSLGSERRFMYKTSINQLCSVDIITVLYTGPGLMRGASCGLGAFQPMEKAPK
jgi:hypothetical protein